MSEELKKCPDCGSESIMELDVGKNIKYCCNSCGLQIKYKKKKELSKSK